MKLLTRLFRRDQPAPTRVVRRTETPLFDQAQLATGVTPEPAGGDAVDDLAAELDLLALPILTGTLAGQNGRLL